ncbi:MAG: peptidoglycan-binding protein [Actinomycetota bacterium]|nr:peptidoglycan-binding protein [Actinomycetota bacterium]
MHARGFFPPGTGQYGPKTLAMVKRLQLLNGLRGSGLLGPKTWRAAWVGRYWLPRHVDTDVPSAPAFPASRSFVYGDNSLVIKRFQDQMHARGFFPVGTGQYGPNTLAMVKRLQLLNGLHGNGLLGPKTWHAAWAGRYWLPTRASATSVPPFPASRSLVYGERNLMIKRFQDQMHARGFFPVGTGQYGPNTLAMVKRLQLQNGLHGSGLIGPETWRAAWLGRYQLP